MTAIEMIVILLGDGGDGISVRSNTLHDGETRNQEGEEKGADPIGWIH
jgi:hypothetical protein